jgi:methionine sulfoxide reductase heme-binding subunit
VNGDPTIWLVARAAGFVAYGLMTASVLAGLVLKSKPFGRKLRAIVALEIHRTLSFLGLAAIGLHGVALVLDDAVHITLSDLVIPGIAPYRPVWTAFGVVAAELMLALIVSFPLRKVFGFKTWRKLHWATYLTFALATLHGLKAGTDTGQNWADWIYIGALGAVAGAVTFRILTRGQPLARPAAPSPTAGASG